MGWLVNPVHVGLCPKEQTVFVYRPQQPEVFDLPKVQLPVPTFAGDLQLTVAELFGWLLA